LVLSLSFRLGDSGAASSGEGKHFATIDLVVVLLIVVERMTMLLGVLVQVMMTIPFDNGDGGNDNEVLMVMEVEWGECVDMVVEVEDSAFSDVVLE